MQRVCFLLRVKKDKLAEYRRAHESVWPEMLAALSRHGWTNYSLFLTDDGLLIGYVETPDFQKAVAGMQGEPINARWQEAMRQYFEPLASGTADKSMQPIQEVFHLD